MIRFKRLSPLEFFQSSSIFLLCPVDINKTCIACQLYSYKWWSFPTSFLSDPSNGFGNWDSQIQSLKSHIICCHFVYGAFALLQKGRMTHLNNSLFPSIHQASGLMALAIMSFQTSQSRAADIISVTLPAPNQDFSCQAFFLFVFPCFFTCLVYQWWENVPNPPFSLHGRKMLLVVLFSAPMICWFLPPSIPSHLFSSLSMVCATFFSGTTFLPPPIYFTSCDNFFFKIPHIAA